LLAAALWISLGSLGRIHLLRQGGWVESTESDGGRRARAFIAGPVLTIVSGIGVIGFLALGALWRSAALETSVSAAPPVPAEQAAAPDSQVAAEPVKPAVEPPVEATKAEVTPPPAPPVGDLGLASPEELSAAISQGTDALVKLKERYPNDAKVLRACAFAQASKSPGLADAAGTLQRLFTLSPEASNDTDLQYMVMQMARTQGDASRRSFKLLGSHMGTVGPDLLYKLSLTHSEQRDQALKTLAQPDTRKHFSPALAVAYELQFAGSCAARLPLLSRAGQFGDERAIRILTPLATDKARGCGPKKNLPCKSTCPKQAEQYLKTAEVIATRLRAHN
jgi:hypothetical protein